MALFHELFYLSYPIIIAYFSINCNRLTQEFSFYSKFAAISRNAPRIAYCPSETISVSCAACQFFLNGEQAVVFGGPFSTTWRTGFDIARLQANCQIRDGRIIRFSGTVRQNRAVPGVLCHLDHLHRLCQCADLVWFDEDRVAESLTDAIA